MYFPHTIVFLLLVNEGTVEKHDVQTVTAPKHGVPLSLHSGNKGDKVPLQDFTDPVLRTLGTSFGITIPSQGD